MPSPMSCFGAALRIAPIAIALFATVSVHAQGPRQQLLRADSLASSGDSVTALRVLDDIVRADRRNAPAWHRRGMIAWTIVQPRRGGAFMTRLEDIRMLELADSSLRMAVRFAPDSARYAMDLGRFLLHSDLSTLRWSATGQFEAALEAARRVGDSLVIAEAADALGMVYWRRYENVADRYLTPAGFPSPNLEAYLGDPKGMQNFMENFTRRSTRDLSGESDYLRAVDLFSQALRANPHHGPALRHVFMSLAERRNWEELRRAADLRIAVAPWDPQPWLARGLALHRLNHEAEASAAFDSALANLTPPELERYTRVARIVRASDSTRLAGLSEDERRKTDRLYWMMSDPLWLTSGNEHRLEFLSRVAYAEMRWTAEDQSLRGADTDRGEIHIRYGPPNVIMGFAPENGVSPVLWYYTGALYFAFRAPPSFGAATFLGNYADYAARIREQLPVSYDNIPVSRSIDSIAVQIVRFRGAGDSTDVFVAAEVPVGRLVRDLDLQRAAVDVAFQAFDRGGRSLLRDSSRTIFGREMPTAVSTRAWRRRVAAGPVIYRIEALQPDGMRGARALGQTNVAAETGFGVSDLMVAERVAPRTDAALRWSEFTIVPSAGRLRRGGSLALLWESYGLTATDGSARYRVALTLERERGSGAGRIAARIFGGIAGAAGRNASGSDRVTLSFDRQVRAREAIVDYFALDARGVPPGRYVLIIQITDLATNRTAIRRTALTVVE